MDFLTQYGLTVLCLAGMLAWYYAPNDICDAKKRFEEKIAQDPFGDYEEPQMASSLGVFGTFLGITVGLLLFQPQDLDNLKTHLASLLGGMTTAFLTSLLGMWLSFCLKQKQEKAQRAKEMESSLSNEANIKDLIEYLMRENEERKAGFAEVRDLMSENNKVLTQTISDSIARMTKSIVGDEEYTVIGQMKTIRLETRDSIDKLYREQKEGNERTLQAFQDFAKTLAENNAKTFIEALTETMKDFNSKLTTQFGENFKKLNEAVGNMLVWQEHYKDMIAQLTAVQQETFQGISEIKQSLGSMETSVAGLNASAEKLADIVVTAAAYEEKIEKALEHLEELAKDADAAVPAIQAMLRESNASLERENQKAQKEMAEYIGNAVKASSDFASKHLESVRDSITKEMQSFTDSGKSAMQLMEELAKALDKDRDRLDKRQQKMLEQLDKRIEDSIRSMEEASSKIMEASKEQRQGIESMSSAAIDSVRAAADSLKKDSFTVTQGVSDNMQKLMEENNDALKGSVKNLQQSLNDSLNQSLNELGRAMGQISQKFAADYQPLADRLREVVRIAEDLEKRRRA